MVVMDFFDSFMEGIEFLIALGSIIGLLGLLIGFIFLIWGTPKMRGKMIGVILMSFILLCVCGINTGIYYFRIFR